MKTQLIHDDAITVLRDMDDASIDLIVTDPPYKVISGGYKNSEKLKVNRGIFAKAKNDGKLFKHNSIKSEEYIGELYRVLKPGRDCYIMTNNLTLRELLNAAHAVGFKLHSLLIWQKNTSNMSRWYRPDSEYTVYLYKPPARTINNPGSKRIFFAPNPRKKKHPTEKPVALFHHYITNSSEKGWVVLDPFMGCGPAAISSIRAGCDFIGIELDDEYFERASKRVVRYRRRKSRSKI